MNLAFRLDDGTHAKYESLILVHEKKLNPVVALQVKVDLVKPLEVDPPILVDPARDHCYPGPTKPCES